MYDILRYTLKISVPSLVICVMNENIDVVSFLIECIESIHRNLDTSTPTCIHWGILFSQQMSKSKLKDKTMGKGKRGKSDTQVKMLWLCGPLAWNLKNNLFKGQCVQHEKTSWFNTVCSSLLYFISLLFNESYIFWRKTPLASHI